MNPNDYMPGNSLRQFWIGAGLWALLGVLITLIT